MKLFWLVITWLVSIHTHSLALRQSILSQSHKLVCTVLKIYSSCQTNILRLSYLTTLLKFRNKAENLKPEAEERIVTVSKWKIYLNILKVIYWGVKEKRGLCLSKFQYLIFLTPSGIQWKPLEPNYCSRERVAILLIFSCQISYFLYLILMNIFFLVQDIYYLTMLCILTFSFREVFLT